MFIHAKTLVVFFFLKPYKVPSWVLPSTCHEAKDYVFLYKTVTKTSKHFSALKNVHGDCTVGWEFCALGHPISSGPRLGLSDCVRTLQWVLTRVPLILQGFLKCHSHLEEKEIPRWAPLTTNYFLKRKDNNRKQLINIWFFFSPLEGEGKTTFPS